MITGNLYLQLPLKTGLLGAFLDAGVYDTGLTLSGPDFSDRVLNTGLCVRMGDIFGVYFPLYMTDNLVNSYGSSKMFDNYARKIRFTLRLNLINKPINFSAVL